MRSAGVIATFVIGFCLAWVAVLTLGQPAFHEPASVRVFFWNTPPVPVFVYLAGAFTLGLLIGLAAAVYVYFVMAGRVRERKRALKQMEAAVGALREGGSGVDNQ